MVLKVQTVQCFCLTMSLGYSKSRAVLMWESAGKLQWSTERNLRGEQTFPYPTTITLLSPSAQHT